VRAEFESFAPGSFDKLFAGKVLLAVRGNWTEIALANQETAEIALGNAVCLMQTDNKRGQAPVPSSECALSSPAGEQLAHSLEPPKEGMGTFGARAGFASTAYLRSFGAHISALPLEAQTSSAVRRQHMDSHLLSEHIKHVALDAKNTEEYAKNANDEMQKTPYAVGTTLGEIKDGWFRLGLEGAYMLGPLARNRFAVVNEKAESLFLYGRDVIGPSVIECRAKKGNNILVLNEKRECIGLGRLVEEPRNTVRTAIKNLRDRGWYIREGW